MRAGGRDGGRGEKASKRRGCESFTSPPLQRGNKQGGRHRGPLYLSVDPIRLQKDGAEARPRMKNLIAWSRRRCGVECFLFVSSSATEDLKFSAPAWCK